MKKLITISAIVMSGLVYNTANAQIRIGIHLFPHRIFVPRPEVIVQAQVPVYQEPVVSDNDDCDFYYLPDVGAYYSVAEQCYYYQDGNNWIATAYLPGVYHNYDWRYAARRYEIREARPYLHNDVYRSRYQGFDRDLARNHDHYGAGFNNNAYNNGQRFDNRGGSDQHFGQQNAWNQRDNNLAQQFNQNNGRVNNGQQANQNQNHAGRGNNNNQNRDNQQRLAQNNNGNDGHNNDKRDRF